MSIAQKTTAKINTDNNQGWNEQKSNKTLRLYRAHRSNTSQ